MDFRLCKRLSTAFFLFSFLLSVQLSFAQLTNFNLQVTATNETCTANGSLAFTVTNTAPNAIIIYRIYRLPDVITPIAVTGSNSFSGLTSGDYRVVAIQSVGNLSNTQQQDIHLNNFIIPLVYTATGTQPTSCGHNGTISIHMTQGNAVSYEIIAGPVIVPPQGLNTFFDLAAGQYIIRVNDACGDGVVQTYELVPLPPNLQIAVRQPCPLIDCNTKLINVEVTPNLGTSILYPITVMLTVFPPNQGPIVFNETIASGFDFISLPFNIPYINDPAYTVSVQVTDSCGNIANVNNLALNVGPSIAVKFELSMDHCTEHFEMELCNLVAPYMVHFLKAPQTFNPTDFNPGNLGPFTNALISYNSTHGIRLPDGHYVFEVTDACGTTVQGEVTVEKKVTDHLLIAFYSGCTPMHLVIIPDEGINPSTVILTDAPSGYDHTLPYDVSFFIDHTSIFNMPVSIPGTYTFTGINVCGDPFTSVVDIAPLGPSVLEAEGSSQCLDGVLGITLNPGPDLLSVTIVQAPPDLSQPLPYDVSSYIHDNLCTVTPLPQGNYTIVATDICGHSYGPIDVTINPPAAIPPLINYLRGCGTGNGSVKIYFDPVVGGRPFRQVLITASPSAFTQPLPFDVSYNIDADGFFYMNTLPEGTYTFHLKDVCNAEQDVIVEIPGYDVIANSVNVIGNCGSFNLSLYHYVYEPCIKSFWLQKYNPQTGGWENPFTGVPYVNGTVPDVVNSYLLQNYGTNYNIASLGTFRILRYSQNYSNGVPELEDCYSVIKEFEFTGELKILSAGAFPCNNNMYDVFIEAGGIAPFTYRITIKDGQPFSVENGNSNFFTGLPAGIYNFQVEDACGNILNRLVDISTLLPPSIFPNDLCDGLSGQLSVQAISFLAYRWWKSTSPGTILSSTNVLGFTPYTEATSPGTYLVHIFSTNNLSCVDTTISYEVLPAHIPNAGLNGSLTVCGNAIPVDLFTLITQPYDTGGIWNETTGSGGNLTGSTWTPLTGQYGSFSFNYTVNGTCGKSDLSTAIVHFNPVPPDPVISIDSELCNNQSVQFNVDPIPGASFQWAGPNNFTSNLQNPSIPNASSANEGLYTITASIGSCQSNASINLDLAVKPNFILVPGCIDNVFTIVVRGNDLFDPNSTYAWSGPSGFTGNTDSVALTGFGAGVYNVTVTDSHGCQSSQTAIIPTAICAHTIPNVITPNDNDSTNQFFDLSDFDVEKLEIYSRWGRLVYEENNYIKEWFGQNMHGKELPDSTYYYIIYLKGEEPKVGWVYKTPWK